MNGEINLNKRGKGDLNLFEKDELSDVIYSYYMANSFYEALIVLDWFFALIIIDTKLSSISKPTCAINKLLISQFKSSNLTNKSLLLTKRPAKPLPNRPFLVLANRIRILMDPAPPRSISPAIYPTNYPLSSFN